MKKIICKIECKGEGFSEDYRLETAIECYRILGSKLYHGVEVITRKLIDRVHPDGTTYCIDYGPITIRHRVQFDKPRRQDTQLLEKEFNIACQKVREILKSNPDNVINF